MNEHVRDDRLNDYVDDLLCREERAEIERHLIACVDCRAEVARLRNLVADIGALPLGVAPGRDLLAGINARIDAGAPAAAPLRSRSVRHLSAAAAAVLVLGGAVALGYILGVQERADVATAPAQQDASPAATARTVAAVDAQYADAAAELERLLAQNRATLRPETVRIIEESLAVIDRALEEARAALRDDPGNPMLEQILRANHEQKLDLLRRAAQVGA